jgi:hypothetical protein
MMVTDQRLQFTFIKIDYGMQKQWKESWQGQYLGPMVAVESVVAGWWAGPIW